MNRILKVLAVGALMVPALGQAAEGLNYNYVDASFGRVDSDGSSAEADVLGLFGSLALNSQWHAFAGFATLDSDDFVDSDSWEVGIGRNHNLGGTTDLVTRLSVVRTSPDVGDDDTGGALSIGVRSQPMPNFEVEGNGVYVNTGGSDEDGVSLDFAGRYFFTPMFAVGLNLEIAEFAKAYGVHFRVNFR